MHSLRVMRSEVRFTECSPFFFGVPFFFSDVFLSGTVCGFTTGYLDPIDYNSAERCSTTYEYVFVYSCHVFLLLLLCVAVLLLLPLQCCCLLMFVIVSQVPQFVAVVYCI